MKKSLRIGTGAGYSGDRIEPAVEIARHGQLDYLVFECLAERTIALAQLRKSKDPLAGFDPLLEARMRACLPICMATNTRIISNMGAANPLSAARKVAEIARDLGLKNLRIAAVTGDEVLGQIKQDSFTLLESGAPLSDLMPQVVSANAYLGVAGIVEAIKKEADVILTGRVADPALFLAPMIVEFGWSMQAYDLLGRGTCLGHLMECGGQVTGGYFADPGFKEVPDLAHLGFPIAEVQPDGTFFITKLPASGGLVSPATCKEQLLYEIHDPSNYFTPDVIADFSEVKMETIEKDRVRITGAKGKAPTGQLKVSVGYREGFIGEGQISYGGSNAIARAELAGQIIRSRISTLAIPCSELRIECIGVNALFGDTLAVGAPTEVRLRVAARTRDRISAEQIGREVEALYTNGPAGGGGARKHVQEVIAIQSILLDSSQIHPQIHLIQV